MDFGWTAEHEAIYAQVWRFAREEFGAVPTRNDDQRSGAAMWRKAAGAGLAGLAVSVEHGGSGYDGLTTARALEAFGRGCPDAGFGFALAAHLLACCVPIDRHGTREQKHAFLPKLCSGEWVGASAITESEAGSDIFATKSRAVARGDEYVLDAQKLFITNAPIADVFLVYAATTPGHGMLGLSAFLVPRQTPGVVVGPTVEKIGLHGAAMAAIRFEGCVVPAACRLGADGAGAAVFADAMRWERSCLFALWIGAMERQLSEAIAHVNGREQFGRPLASNQAVSHRIVEMALRLESARLLLYRACWHDTRGCHSELATSMAKLAVSEAFVQSSLDAVRVFGARGVIADCGIERYLRDAVPSTIYSGTSEMQREIVARELGLAVFRGR